MKPIIGLEIHVQLKTKSKMFCSCDAKYFGTEPNTHMCPVCLALPGALPVANKKALESAVKVGLALNCKINNFSKFDRKNYMYPDLFKGYQITQYEIPICENGYLDIRRKDGTVLRIGIIRAHQEEDTAKSIHESTYTLIDGNKAGVPLLEIVSAPDMRSLEDANLFAQHIYNTLRFIGVSDCDMEKGQMRFDVNINLEIDKKEHDGRDEEIIATPIVEIKNLNSFRSMERAIKYEVERQEEEYKKTGIKLAKGNKTTRGWSDDKGYTYLLRSKEEAEDYRYFPDPDLPPVIFSDEQIDEIRSQIGEVPADIYTALLEQYGLNDDLANFFSFSENAKYFYVYLKECLDKNDSLDPKVIASWIKGDVAFNLYERGFDFDEDDLRSQISIPNLIDLLTLLKEGKISSINAKEVLVEIMESKNKESASSIVTRRGLLQIQDEDAIMKIIEEVISKETSAVENYMSGKTSVLMFLVGQVMRELKGKGDPNNIKTMIEKKLK